MKYTVTNIDGIEKQFSTDAELLTYTKLIYSENEDGQPYPSELHWSPETIQQAKEYLNEYCDNLDLIEN